VAPQLELSEVNASHPSTSDQDEKALEASTDSEMPAEPAPLSETTEEDVFFAHDNEISGSLAPLAGDIEMDEPKAAAPDPSLLSDRRARLRKIVTIVVGGASALAAFVLVKAMLTRHAQAAPVSASLNSFGPVVASIEMNPKPAATSVVGETAETPPVAAAAAAEPAEVAEVRIEVFDEPAEQAPAPKANAPAPASAPRANTKMDARRFLAAGKLKEAVSAARAALAAEPTDAETYLLLGAALQDTGHWEESMIVFASCVQNAKRGPLGDCRALSRR
jgi:hypothetical protein